MKGSECRLVKYMEGSDKRFVIPVYQRNYDWKTEHCKQLFDDLVKIVRDHRKSHFFGSVVSVYDPNGAHEEFLIIDGQQRLTTVSLLLLAMYHLLASGVLVSQTANLQQRIFEEYLVDKWQPQETRIKLKPVKGDRQAFDRLFADPAQPVRDSRLTANYDYFYERLQKREVTVDELYDALCRLEIIHIRLDGDDDPQRIFESLNSTGLDLSEGDKIRNFILMGLPSAEQEAYYEKYWNPIEVCTHYGVSAFVRDYLSVKQQVIPQQNKIYVHFKEYVEPRALAAEPLLQDMLAYARRYRTLLGEKTGTAALDGCIARLNHLETTVTRPFFLEVLRLQDEGQLTAAQVTEVFLCAESYLFRRSICELPTNALNKIFLLLHREILRYDGTAADYVEKCRYALLSKKERARFPEDAEFAAAFATRPVYLMNGKNKVYILERLENAGTAEDKDVYRHCEEGTYSIEHILPQHLTPAWQKELGEDWAQIQETWLHRIANLTLTAYNSRYGNSTFWEKKTMPNGFADSGIRLNTWIAQKDRWTLAELKERSAQLTARALQIWPLPQTAFVPQHKQLESCTLEEEAALTGRQIARFAFRNSEQPVASWAEMFEKAVQILYAEDRTVVTALALSGEEGLAQHFFAGAAGEAPGTAADKTADKAAGKAVAIGDGLFVWTNTSTQSKLSVLRRLFKLYGADAGDLVFFLREEGAAPGEAEGRLALRRRYWAYALPLIKAAQGPDGCFLGVNPTKDNWITGSFGVSGYYLCCVANQDSARVELVLQKPDRDANKQTFDDLFAHKAAIEETLGAALHWNRAEDKKASKVYVLLPDVELEDEAGWPRLAQFHAAWSRKFYDVIVPLVR